MSRGLGDVYKRQTLVRLPDNMALIEERLKLYMINLWSRSYYMGTLGNMSKEVVERYIANQRRLKVTLADHLSKENGALRY